MDANLSFSNVKMDASKRCWMLKYMQINPFLMLKSMETNVVECEGEIFTM